MACDSCESNRRQFPAEISIHFRGLEKVDKPHVWVFPELSVCLRCGETRFVMPERELHTLSEAEGISTISMR